MSEGNKIKEATDTNGTVDSLEERHPQRLMLAKAKTPRKKSPISKLQPRRKPVSKKKKKNQPEHWAKATVKNEWGSTITNVHLHHRFEYEHFDGRSWKQIKNDTTAPGFAVGYWTGWFSGKDYWYISFEADGKIWTCKRNLYCFLTKADEGKLVVIRVYKDGEDARMQIICPGSSDCNNKTLVAEPKLRKARPVYLIGHRLNDPEDIGKGLAKGCNAIECDLKYDKDREQIFVNHDFETGDKFEDWLEQAKRLKDVYGEKFALIIFDCKFANDHKDRKLVADVMRRVRKEAREALNQKGSKLNLLFSIASFKNRDGFDGILGDLRKNEGIAIDESSEPDKVEKYFRSRGVKNCWFANGMFTWLHGSQIFPSVERGCILRDTNGLIKKVYSWTVVMPYHMRFYINEARIDAIMVNVEGTIAGSAPPGRLDALRIIKDSNLARFAKRSDPAFEVYGKHKIR